MDCVHFFNVDCHNVGTCSKCGEVRQYPWGRGEVVVLKKGNPSINEVSNYRSIEVSKEGNMSRNHTNRRKYYAEHEEEIKADLLSIGRLATGKKWNVPKGGAIYSLESRLLTPEQRASMSSSHPTASTRSSTTPTPQPNPGQTESLSGLVMPKFPEFNDTWSLEVQLAWFEVYDKLLSTVIFPSIVQPVSISSTDNAMPR